MRAWFCCIAYLTGLRRLIAIETHLPHWEPKIMVDMIVGVVAM